MVRSFIFSSFLFLSLFSEAQNAPGYYYVVFRDKVGTPFSIQFPQAFLSPRAIEKRERRNIPITEQDLPVNPSYIEQVVQATGGSLHHQSKWMNSMTLNLSQLDSASLVHALDTLQQLLCVAQVKCSAQTVNHQTKIQKDLDKLDELTNPDSTIYGVSFHQLDMINTPRLHEFGLTGKEMHIAQLDAGWSSLESIAAFDRLRFNQQIILTRDFVNPQQPNVYQGSYHGTFVLGHMAGFIADSLMGSAPEAHYYLMKTENAATEYRIEEDNWVAAIELCDSLGVDVVNSSLGYSIFDDTTMNYTQADMNGDVSRASIAADIAASKGLLIVNSAGNSGNSDWYNITAPSDADSILCIGAVDYAGNHAGFSSYGLSNSEAVKPNVAAMGQSTYFPGPNGYMAQGSGTSFSSPIVAGSVACLWQAFPEKTNMEIIRAVEQSASLFPQHNTSLGYGIPDFWKAYLLLNSATQLNNQLIAMIFPNPAEDVLHLKTTGSPIYRYEIFNVNGQCMESMNWELAWHQNYLDLSIHQLTSGEYLLKIYTKDGVAATPFQKR
jgi:serine protease AprX